MNRSSQITHALQNDTCPENEWQKTPNLLFSEFGEIGRQKREYFPEETTQNYLRQQKSREPAFRTKIYTNGPSGPPTY